MSVGDVAEKLSLTGMPKTRKVSSHITMFISLFKVWWEQKERAYFKLGNLLSAETQLNSLRNLKYPLSFCPHHTLNRLIARSTMNFVFFGAEVVDFLSHIE